VAAPDFGARAAAAPDPVEPEATDDVVEATVGDAEGGAE
jgi:hypothetical protein